MSSGQRNTVASRTPLHHARALTSPSPAVSVCARNRTYLVISAGTTFEPPASWCGSAACDRLFCGALSDAMVAPAVENRAGVNALFRRGGVPRDLRSAEVGGCSHLHRRCGNSGLNLNIFAGFFLFRLPLLGFAPRCRRQPHPSTGPGAEQPHVLCVATWGRVAVPPCYAGRRRLPSHAMLIRCYVDALMRACTLHVCTVLIGAVENPDVHA